MYRLATYSDLPAIQELERAAGQAFRSLGMDAVADDQPIQRRAFAEYVIHAGAWVSIGADREIAAYLLIERLDDAAHIEQITVHPRASRRGVGAGLLRFANRWAAHRGLTTLTLTTFRDVPWNAPYYSRLGFSTLEVEQCGPGLQARVWAEAAHGLDGWPRVVMRRAVPDDEPAVRSPSTANPHR